jgi:hypothetical protein
MAIVIEEAQKDRTNLWRFLAWFGVFIVIAAAVYYIFFAAPELVVVTPSGNFNAIAPIANISLDPSSVLQNQAFQSLQSTVPPPSPSGPAAVGRSNPFIAP